MLAAHLPDLSATGQSGLATPGGHRAWRRTLALHLGQPWQAGDGLGGRGRAVVLKLKEIQPHSSAGYFLYKSSNKSIKNNLGELF
jgi:hypothetical protein